MSTASINGETRSHPMLFVRTGVYDNPRIEIVDGGRSDDSYTTDFIAFTPDDALRIGCDLIRAAAAYYVRRPSDDLTEDQRVIMATVLTADL